MQTKQLPEQLQLARLALVRQYPYLATAVWQLIPIEKPGIETLAVDKWWRLYYDPQVLTKWSPQQLASVIYHEICHLLRAHHERAEAMGADPTVFNVAADCAINDDLIKEQFVEFPHSPVLPSTFNFPDNLLEEEYYERLQQLLPQSQTTTTLATSLSSEVEEADSSAGDEGAASDTEAGASGDSSSGDAEPSMDSASSNQSPDASASTEAALSDPAAAADEQQSDGGTGAGQMSPADSNVPRPGQGRCGSCATGQQESWELGHPDECGVPGISSAESELIRRQVAEAIKVASATQDRGTVPGHWRRWAEETLTPRVNWRRQLAAAVRHAISDVSGAVDYTYKRPARRQTPPVIKPALRHPIPNVAVIVDTSGSVDDASLTQALAEIKGILQATGLREGVTVLAVDAEVQTCKKVFRPDQVQLVGGGGTDMGKGIAAALKLRPRPNVVIVLTDGYTPWPEQAPPVRVIVSLLAKPSENFPVPSWAQTVEVKTND